MGIILRVHNDFITNAQAVPIESPIVRSLRKEFKFTKFIGDLTGNFGFDDAFIRLGKNGEFVELLINIPQVKKDSGKKCPECNGTGKYKQFKLSMECRYCEGSGKLYSYDWQTISAVSASCTILFLSLKPPEKETSASYPQLLLVETITGTGQDIYGGGSLWGEYGIDMCHWLRSLNQQNTINEIT